MYTKITHGLVGLRDGRMSVIRRRIFIPLKKIRFVDQLTLHIESLIFAAPQPISVKDIRSCLELAFQQEFNLGDIEQAVAEIKQKYQHDNYAIEVVELADGLQFLSKGAYFSTIAAYLKLTHRKKLSAAALESLAIIAYKQPVTKVELESIRGVNCDYAIQKLLEKELVEITGRSEAPGRPLLYATSKKFMEYFGLKSMRDLPQIKDFEHADQQIGEVAPVDESVSVSESTAS